MKTRKRLREEEAELVRREKESRAAKRVKKSRRCPEKGEDYLSDLPSDCLRDILERLSHEDLDAVATVSKRLSSVAAASRNRAERVVADRITIVQFGDRSFDFRLGVRGSLYTARFTNNNCRSGLLSKVIVRQALPESTDDRNHFLFKAQSISHAITTRAAHLLQRFEIKRCFFEYVSIDDHFLSFLELLLSSSSFIALELNACYFDANISTEGRQRLAPIISSAKPSKLRLDMPYDLPVLNELFLEDFAQFGTSLDLVVFTEDDESTTRRPSAQFGEALPNFQNIVMLSMTLDMTWIMLPVFKRLRAKKEGYWKFRVTRQLSFDDIQRAADAALLLWPNANRLQHGRIMFPIARDNPTGYYLRTVNEPPDFIVQFNTIRDSFVRWTFIALFGVY